MELRCESKVDATSLTSPNISDLSNSQYELREKHDVGPVSFSRLTSRKQDTRSRSYNSDAVESLGATGYDPSKNVCAKPTLFCKSAHCNWHNINHRMVPVGCFIKNYCPKAPFN